jgi:hypothetical protein
VQDIKRCTDRHQAVVAILDAVRQSEERHKPPRTY